MLPFADKVTAMAIAGMLPITAAGLSAALLRSRHPRTAALTDPPDTV